MDPPSIALLGSVAQYFANLFVSIYLMAISQNDIVYYFSAVSLALSITLIHLVMGSAYVIISQGKVPEYLKNTFQISSYSLLFSLFYHFAINYVNNIFSGLAYLALFVYIVWCISTYYKVLNQLNIK
jgi:hypothetical protein